MAILQVPTSMLTVMKKSNKWLTLFALVAGNESCPQPQTSEHLAAIEIMKLKHILILQNKIDLVKESQAKEQYEQILAFVQGKGALLKQRKDALTLSSIEESIE